MARIPKICWHKGMARWYVTLNGREEYLSTRTTKTPVPPADVKRKYDDLMAVWFASRGKPREIICGHDPDIAELFLAYKLFTQGYYRKHGRTTTEAGTIKQACAIAYRLFPRMPARKFGPKNLVEVRDAMVDRGWSRRHVNKQIGRVRGMFRWAVEQELIPNGVWESLKAVAPLKKGRTPAPEENPVKPVEWSTVEATLPYLEEPLPAMVRAHWLIGCRAAEIVSMRRQDIDTAGELWKWVPWTWKTEHHENEQLYYFIGPKCQEILRPLLLKADPWIFSTAGKKGGKQGRIGCYTTQSYRRAVARAIEKTNKILCDNSIITWYPLMIRHSRATEIRSRPWGGHAGLEAVQAITKHRELSTAEIYAEKSDALAMLVMREIG